MDTDKTSITEKFCPGKYCGMCGKEYIEFIEVHPYISNPRTHEPLMTQTITGEPGPIQRDKTRPKYKLGVCRNHGEYPAIIE